MSTYVPRKLRKLVIERAADHCEYCQAFAQITPEKFHIEHIQPLSKGGEGNEQNLCLACSACNLAKHNFTEGIDPETDQSQLLFNPRKQVWRAHFEWSEDGLILCGVSATGRATIDRLGLNRDNHVNARRYWIKIGTHPPNL